MLEHLIERYGYVAVFIGTFLEGESALLLGGALAHRGLLALPPVAIAAFAGAVLGDQTWFRIGRHYGRAFLARHPRAQKHHARAEASLKRFGDGFVIGFRFIVGIRSITPLLLGTTAYSASRFLLLNVIGCAIWATAVAVAGYLLGAGVKELFERTGRIQELAIVALVAGVSLLIAARSWWARRATKP
jgi:membrane protein DedA with SNARE-associated domain